MKKCTELNKKRFRNSLKQLHQSINQSVSQSVKSYISLTILCLPCRVSPALQFPGNEAMIEIEEPASGDASASELDLGGGGSERSIDSSYERERERRHLY